MCLAQGEGRPQGGFEGVVAPRRPLGVVDRDLHDPAVTRLGQDPRDVRAGQPQFRGHLGLGVALLVVQAGGADDHGGIARGGHKAPGAVERPATRRTGYAQGTQSPCWAVPESGGTDPGGTMNSDPHSGASGPPGGTDAPLRSEEHTSELQSRGHLVCRLLLEKKKKKVVTPVKMPTQWSTST